MVDQILEVSLSDLLSVKIQQSFTPMVTSFLTELHKKYKKKENPLASLLSIQKKTTRNIIRNSKGMRMISFPMYWFKQWENQLYIALDLRNDVLIVETCTDKSVSTHKLIKIGKVHYIKLDEKTMDYFNYPEVMQLTFYGSFLELNVTEAEKEKIKGRKSEIDKIKLTEKRKIKYSQCF